MDEAIAMAAQAGLPYTGLRGFTVDTRLWHYVPFSSAERTQLIPVLLAGDTLTVAVADPAADLSWLQRAFPGLALAKVVAPAAEIQRLLARGRGTE